MACEYFSSASANCPFLNSRFPSFFSRDRGGGRAPHGASRLTVSPVFPPTEVPLPLLLWSAWTEAVEPLLLVPLVTFSCVTLYLSELPPLLLQCPWWELLCSLCGPPSPLPWGFFWAFPMSPLSAGAAELSSPPTGWLGSTGQAGRGRGREGEAEGDTEQRGRHTHRKESVVTSQWGRVGHTWQSHFKGGVPGSSRSHHWITEVLGGGRAANTRTMSRYPGEQGEFPLSIAQADRMVYYNENDWSIMIRIAEASSDLK